MRLATVMIDGAPIVGVMLGDGRLRRVRDANSLRTVIAQVADRGIEEVALGDPISVVGARVCAPVWPPRREVFAVGLNYPTHVVEGGRELPTEPTPPVFFTKASTTVCGAFDDVPLHPRVTQQLDYEVEVAIVIGRRSRDLTLDKAWDSVFGLTIANDVSARDLQLANGGQWFRGKSLDGTCPMGPYVVTTDEIDRPEDIELVCFVNGEERQRDRVGAMLHSIPELLVALSLGLTLMPGDIVLTGTPGGVGMRRNPPSFLAEGDIVECSVPGWGALRNRITASANGQGDDVRSFVGREDRGGRE